jgi:hypothetical protein
MRMNLCQDRVYSILRLEKPIDFRSLAYKNLEPYASIQKFFKASNCRSCTFCSFRLHHGLGRLAGGETFQCKQNQGEPHERVADKLDARERFLIHDDTD